MPPLRIRYQTLEIGHVDIHIRTLWDHLQYEDAEGVAENLGISSAAWPFFGVVWPSGEVLAHCMLDYEIEGKRILEVGCGIGLASLVLNHRLADITATDYHPEVGGFLEKNVILNKGEKIPFVRAGWDDGENELGIFDLIIGSDLLYESGHVDILSGFIDLHARQQCDVVIVDPGRGLHARFSKKMKGLGYSHSRSKPPATEYLEKPFKGWVLSYSR
ncbi:class I SAM-dependent methyltransferase [Desulfospira joergensenii]|uniref:class I SAM-dependent methyltransferase n=1 Tax=Desulfospira joergensenii TaxID=53329 RepID=UPI0003FD6D5C|nr:histidine kinase [Desulfospira joergensenii]